ncbi:MAG: adenylate kinase [Eubacteriales bacterium]|nr:adenylate kinase [Eubacteriales bacterium]
MNIIFLGAPGAGKGTQAEKLSEKLGIPTISTGAIIRDAIKSGTGMGAQAKAYTERGALVPDDVVIGIVKERLAKSDCQNGWILDGFPRTVPQAAALEEMGVKIDAVISLEIPDDAIVSRMSGRRVCPACGATFHVADNPSAAGDCCDRCGAPLIIRKDDAPEVVLSRLEVYHAQSEPLKSYYGSRVIRVDVSEGSPSENFAKTVKALGLKA